jgi:predicted ATP-dependent protease
VVFPASNTVNLILDDDVSEAVAAGNFHLYAATTVDEALELFTGVPAADIYERVARQLEEFDHALDERDSYSD